MQRRRSLLLAAFVSAAAAPPVSAATDEYYEIMAARNVVQKLVKDEQAVRTMTTMGMSTAPLEPPAIAFRTFQKLEKRVSDPETFMDAAIEYVEYSRDATDLFALARLGRANGAGQLAIADYLDRAMVAAKGADKALSVLVPLLPSVQ